MNKNNTKKDEEKRYKRKSFRDLIKNKYLIKEDRLFYKYERFKGNAIEKKIPYIREVPFIFYTTHVDKITHFSIRQSKINLKIVNIIMKE